jgi:hypothetical protein
MSSRARPVLAGVFRNRDLRPVARTDVLLYALEKVPFVTAVTGHAPAARAAEEVVDVRLVAAGGWGGR